MILASSFIDNVGGKQISKEDLEKSLKNQFGDKASVEDNEDGSFLVTIDENQYYLGEDGEVIDSTNMVKISTVDELKEFRDNVNNGNSYEGKYVYLTDDITLNSSEEWEPIGYYSQDTESIRKVLENEKNKPFSGIFDGHGHTINNMHINTSNIVQGLFGLVINGEIKSINIAESCSINTGGNSGSVVGYMYNTGKISGCKNYANLNQVNGGIVGNIAGSITVSDCINYGDIQNGSGGIVGGSNGTDWEEFTNVQHSIINCGNYGNITNSRDYTGGIVGFVKGNVLNCYNVGNITTNRIYAAGIAGSAYGNIKNCYNLGNVQCGMGNVGGIGGSTTGKIENCYNKGDITGNYSVGEINGAGKNGTIVENCYSKNDEFTASDLGTAYEEDTNNINDGYPILQWQ